MSDLPPDGVLRAMLRVVIESYGRCEICGDEQSARHAQEPHCFEAIDIAALFRDELARWRNATDRRNRRLSQQQPEPEMSLSDEIDNDVQMLMDRDRE